MGFWKPEKERFCCSGAFKVKNLQTSRGERPTQLNHPARLNVLSSRGGGQIGGLRWRGQTSCALCRKRHSSSPVNVSTTDKSSFNFPIPTNWLLCSSFSLPSSPSERDVFPLFCPQDIFHFSPLTLSIWSSSLSLVKINSSFTSFSPQASSLSPHH